ncbi:MAG: hypothetical protein JAY99_18250 [Candidatus Thiodiazotropha lotti]|uniref:Uncharacterized protein n=1 Tax=Candidatus Thiodiazotropha endoloripes TaxID=1818881 RepID=A0A1E2UQ96_9GAMM|nr:hypothetical protein [Candidatus Thiodiazotropha endoloripes]MCG7897584.1 hypothetical protein [Candidatus Thiodiazotropha weberae]MCG7992484.1 hypothetical protein [Candidatus Thiodiazotropha lotti]MCG7900834.1 hypothetical protein [Candidatus Thiodiazotropha weberae]MCG7914822.1 hypothetical protein [Candidatus Thiodiazotropha weberae]MCG8001461.1 hypothetical protein [Candidatus Thiodiazotropha lotti]
MKWLYLSIGSLSIVSGLITFLLPVPIGVPLLLVGTPIIMRHSPTGRRWIMHMLRRFPAMRKRIKEHEARIAKHLDDDQSG